jgi:hypothetical protein
VLGLIKVLDDNGAALDGHEGNLSYSLFVRLWKSGPSGLK